MVFPEDSCGPETVANMARAYEEAWQEIKAAGTIDLTHCGNVISKHMALRILEAAHNGEQDPRRLKEIALGAADGRGALHARSGNQR